MHKNNSNNEQNTFLIDRHQQVSLQTGLVKASLMLCVQSIVHAVQHDAVKLHL